MQSPHRLRAGSIGAVASTVIGVASTAPAYSLAVSVGLLVAAVGNAAPLALLLSVVPMFLIALCYRELNGADPDCGTTFAWTQRAFGRRWGWLAGWSSIGACLLVMANLAQVSAIYFLTVFGWESWADSVWAQGTFGTGFILLMAFLAYRGIQLAARVQFLLLAFEVVALVVFVVIAFAHGASLPNWSVGGEGAWGAALLVGVFLYWGWDSSFSVNEESTEPGRTPAVAALVANALLVVIYVLVAWAALAAAGADRLVAIGEDDFFAVLGREILGSTGGTIFALAVFTSAVASTQTTILPAARSLLSMANHGSLPSRLRGISTFGTPSWGTWLFTGCSAVVFLALLATSDSVLPDSAPATAVLIAIYYGATCAALPRFFRGQLSGGRNRLFRVVLPVGAAALCAALLILAATDMSSITLGAVVATMLVGAVNLAFLGRYDAETSSHTPDPAAAGSDSRA